MKQAPRWLPYRIRDRVDQARINAAVRPLNKTRPYPVEAGAQADAEVHMLLCKRDLRIGVLAVKSLLRFAKNRLALTITDDGSLTANDRQWVNGHLPGLRWLFWPEAAETEKSLAQALATRPLLKKLYHSSYAPAGKLLHPVALARCDRVIVMDPDTAFFKPPQHLLDWITSDDLHGWYMHDHQDEAKTVPPEAIQAFADLEAKLVPQGRAWGVTLRLFNSGLLVFRPRQLDLDIAEKYLQWHKALPEAFRGRIRGGKLEIWFGDWTPEQTCYHVMFALSNPAPKPLGGDYHLGGQSGHVFNHFLRHYLVRSGTLKRLRQLIAEL